MVRDELDCGRRCLGREGCKSYNYEYHITSSRRHTCELNSERKEEKPDSYTVKYGYVYYAPLKEIKVWNRLLKMITFSRIGPISLVISKSLEILGSSFTRFAPIRVLNARILQLDLWLRLVLDPQTFPGPSFLRRYHCPPLENGWENGGRTGSDTENSFPFFSCFSPSLFLRLSTVSVTVTKGVAGGGGSAWPFFRKTSRRYITVFS